MESVGVLDALEARGAAAVGALNAASAALVGVIADALVTEAWRGFNSPEHWISVRFGLSHHRARKYVAAARALTVLPEIRAAYAAGELSEDHVAVIAAAKVTGHHDHEVVELARHATVGQLRHAVKCLPREPAPKPDDDKDDEKPAAPRRFLVRRWNDDGDYELHGLLDPLAGAVIDKAIDAAREKLFRHRHPNSSADSGDVAAKACERVSAADALAHAAGLALDAMDPATAANPNRMPSDRYVINIHLDGHNAERVWLHLGPLLPPGLREQLLQDALVRIWAHRRDGTVDLGRTRRTADPKLRLAVEYRDGGCVTGGCDTTRGLKMHHVHEWEHGGPTDLANLVAVCSCCHGGVHKGRYRVVPDDRGGFTVTDTNGRPLAYRPPPPRPDPRSNHPPTAWINRRGDRADWACLWWSDLPPPDTS